MSETDALIPNEAEETDTPSTYLQNSEDSERYSDEREKKQNIKNIQSTERYSQNGRHEPGTQHKERQIRRTWRHYFLFVAISLELFGGGMLSYIVNEWIHAVLKKGSESGKTPANVSACHLNHSDPEYKVYFTVQQQSSSWQMYYTLASSGVSIFSNMFLPILTDFYGRKFFLNLCLFGKLIRGLAIVFIIYYDLQLYYIVLAYAVEGATGGSFGLFSVSFSIIADVTPERKDRTFAIVITEALLIFTMVLAGLGVGLYIENYGFLYPSITNAGLSLAALLCAFFIIPETLNKDLVQGKPSIRRNFQKLLGFYTSKTFEGQRKAYIFLIMAFAWRSIGENHRSSIETVYQLGMPFCWSPSMIGYFASVRRSLEGVVGLGSIRLLQRCLADDMIAILSSVSNIASLVMEAFATTDLVVFFVPCLATLSFLVVPILRSMLSLMTPASEQGAVFAGIGLVEVIGSLVGSFSTNSIYSASLTFMNGFVFLALGGFVMVSVIFLVLYRVTRKKKSHPNEETIVKAS